MPAQNRYCAWCMRWVEVTDELEWIAHTDSCFQNWKLLPLKMYDWEKEGGL